MAPMLIGLQQQSPIPCQMTIGVGEEEEDVTEASAIAASNARSKVLDAIFVCGTKKIELCSEKPAADVVAIAARQTPTTQFYYALSTTLID